jgi:hypothetical protein
MMRVPSVCFKKEVLMPLMLLCTLVVGFIIFAYIFVDFLKGQDIGDAVGTGVVCFILILLTLAINKVGV